APHLSCYDDIDRIIPGDGIPVEAEAAAPAARAAGARDHLAAIDDLDVVGLHIKIVVDAHEARPIAEIVAVVRDAFAAGIARPVAGQHAGWRTVDRWRFGAGLLLRRRWRRRRHRFGYRRRRRWRLGRLDRLAHLDLLLEIVLQGAELGLQVFFIGVRVVERGLQ